MSLTVKAFLYRHSWNEEPVEIRRFSLDQDVSSNYAYLVQKIGQVFPSLPPDDLVVAWTDAEGDTITISSDEELLEALDQFDGTIFKIHLKRRERSCAFICRPPQQPVFGESPHETSQPSGEKEGEEGEGKTKEEATPTGQPPSSGQQQTPQLHPGVICDGCSSSIYGTRFKCLVCPDYDLCSSCENKGLHVDHNMVSIHEPHSYNPWGFHHGPRHGGPWRCRGRGGYHHGRGWGAGHGRGWGPGHGHGWGAGHSHGWGPWVHPYFWRHLHGAPPGCCGSQPTRQPPQSSEAMETEQPAAGSTQPQTEEQAQLEQEQRQSYLQDIGEAVSNFLRPFGVKVDVGVVDEGPPKSSAEAPSAPTQVPSGSDSNTAYPPTLDPADPSQTTSEQAASAQYPPPPPSAGADPDAIQQIVTQLRGMGFDDEGGWLTELAKAKGGDIGKVLDALNPSQTD